MSSQICMICENTKCLRPVNEIFSKEGMIWTYLDALYRCLNIQFLDNWRDGVNRICGRCVAKLQYCCAFRRDVEAAHRRQYQIIDTTVSNTSILNCEWKIENDKDFDGKNSIKDHAELYSHDDYCGYLDSVDDCNINDSSYHSDWSADTDEILQATGFWNETKETDFTIGPSKQDYNLCDLCGKIFKQRQDLQNHIKSHTGIGLKCTDCDKIFYAQRKLTMHIKTCHQGHKYRKCSECNVRFSSIEGKRKHLWEMHQKKAFPCFHCVKTFGSKTEVKKHIKQEHFEIAKFNCVECDMVFMSKHTMQQHMVGHTGIKDQHCEICSKSFARRKTLMQHMKTHNKPVRKKEHHYGNSPQSRLSFIA